MAHLLDDLRFVQLFRDSICLGITPYSILLFSQSPYTDLDVEPIDQRGYFGLPELFQATF